MTGNLEIRETKTKPQAIETSSPAHAAEASPTPWALRPCGHGSLKPPYNQGPCCLGPIPPASPNLPTTHLTPTGFAEVWDRADLSSNVCGVALGGAGPKLVELTSLTSSPPAAVPQHYLQPTTGCVSSVSPGPSLCFPHAAEPGT